MSHRPRKRFGQHFLRDAGVIARIAATFNPQPDDTVVEIGPGEGVLTRALAGKVRTLHLVELDRDLVVQLQRDFPPAIATIHSADALRFDFRSLAPPGGRIRVIGNLPYNITTPILFHLLDQVDAIRDMEFMLQKEVVDRLAAAPDCKDYGRLSVMIQIRLAVERLFDVPPHAFRPPPKVESSVVRLTPLAAAPVAIRDPAVFARLVQTAFAQRRKTLRNNLREVMSAGQLDALGIDPGRRAETLTLEEFARLANALA
jgi:16S rRNA (adenine1518-N6/adenine1519-N6)-dimethyltransferase